MAWLLVFIFSELISTSGLNISSWRNGSLSSQHQPFQFQAQSLFHYWYHPLTFFWIQSDSPDFLFLQVLWLGHSRHVGCVQTKPLLKGKRKMEILHFRFKVQLIKTTKKKQKMKNNLLMHSSEIGHKFKQLILLFKFSDSGPA